MRKFQFRTGIPYCRCKNFANRSSGRRNKRGQRSVDIKVHKTAIQQLDRCCEFIIVMRSNDYCIFLFYLSIDSITMICLVIVETFLLRFLFTIWLSCFLCIRSVDCFLFVINWPLLAYCWVSFLTDDFVHNIMVSLLNELWIEQLIFFRRFRIYRHHHLHHLLRPFCPRFLAETYF